MSTTALKTIGLLHPGAMGASVGAAAIAAGAEVYWLPAGRSQASAGRAERAGLRPLGSLAELVWNCEMIVSVCPPAAALRLARQVAGEHFAGLYLDANAVAPATAGAVRETVEATGARYVDGGIIGPPAWRSGSTRLYLSGAEAERAAAAFATGPLETVAIGPQPAAASALKMAYAAYTKGHSALLLAVRGLAAAAGVERPLLDEWRRSQPALQQRSERAAQDNAAKAWRFEAEMNEIAETFAGCDLPDGFHRGAAELYRRLAGFKGRDEVSLAEVVAALTPAPRR